MCVVAVVADYVVASGVEGVVVIVVIVVVGQAVVVVIVWVDV